LGAVAVKSSPPHAAAAAVLQIANKDKRLAFDILQP
jgi:hypothetical protein